MSVYQLWLFRSPVCCCDDSWTLSYWISLWRNLFTRFWVAHGLQHPNFDYSDAKLNVGSSSDLHELGFTLNKGPYWIFKITSNCHLCPISQLSVFVSNDFSWLMSGLLCRLVSSLVSLPAKQLESAVRWVEGFSSQTWWSIWGVNMMITKNDKHMPESSDVNL